MLLSDGDIKKELDSGRVKVEPFDPAMLQPSSVDVRLDRFFRVFENHKYSVIDPAAEQSDLTRAVEVSGDEEFILHPGEFVLASTYEVITLPDDRSRLFWPHHFRTFQRCKSSSKTLSRNEDRPTLFI